MNLKLQLSLVATTLLLLPWAGCQTIQEMEQVLRTNQAQALTGQGKLLRHWLEQDWPAVYNGPTDVFYTPRRFQPVQVDGYGDDWQSHASQAGYDLVASDTHLSDTSVSLQTGLRDGHIYGLLQVDYTPLRYHSPGAPVSRADHVRLQVEISGQSHEWLLYTSAPGVLRPLEWRHDTNQLVPITALTAVWQETPTGYTVEFSLPATHTLTRMDISVFRVLDSQQPAQAVWSTRAVGNTAGSIWVYPDTGYSSVLATLRNDTTDAVIVDRQGWPRSPQRDWRVESVADAQPSPGNRPPADLLSAALNRLYRGVIDQLSPAVSDQPWPLPTLQPGRWQTRLPLENLPLPQPAQPIAGWYALEAGAQAALLVIEPLGDAMQPAGYLILTQTSEPLLSLTDQVMQHGIHRMVLVLSVCVGILLLFASVLSWRIRRLQQGVTSAVSQEGRVETLPQSTRNDEIGALNRSVAELLGRIREHHQYLESLTGRLAHELRTPLTIVRSSLELVRPQPGTETYLERAVTGSERLSQLLSVMTEASRVEQSLSHEEFQDFSVALWFDALAQAYTDLVPTGRVTWQRAPELAHTQLHGSPERLAQMLDKLFDNANRFAPADGPAAAITLSLRPAQPAPATLGSRAEIIHSVWLEVSNRGPLLPLNLQGSWQETGSTATTENANTPHLGFGLYIARLIARAHGGQLSGFNQTDDSGVTFRVTLPCRPGQNDRH